MDTETVQSIIQDIIDEHDDGFIDRFDGNHYEFYLQAPNGNSLFVIAEIPDYLEDEHDVKDYILQEIRSAAFRFDIDDVFDQIYALDEMTPPSTIMARLKEDKEYFENI